MGDRQDFLLNYTNMTEDQMIRLTEMHLKRISDKMKLGLKQENLLKTGHYRQIGSSGGGSG